MDRLLLVVEELKITYSPIDRDGDVDELGIPVVLTQSSDLHALFKDHVIRSTVNQIKQPFTGPITFQKEFVYVFKMNASHIKMPPNWKRDAILDADEISSPWVLGLKEKIQVATHTSSKPSSSSAPPLEEMIQWMIDAQILLATNLDPTTFGQAIATAVSSTMTASTGTIGTQVSAGITKAMEDVLIPALQAGIPTYLDSQAT
jgi:hypothetical protein